MQEQDCIFCKIVRGELPSHKIWEDDKHLAFLSLNPNTEGFTVVITKEHYPSYAFDLADDILCGLTLAAKKVGKLIDSRFDDVGRTGLIYEGFGINHIHAKLFPMHGTKDDQWKQHISGDKKFFENYEGYIASNDSMPASQDELIETANKITGKNGK